MDKLQALQEQRTSLGEEIQRWRDKISADDYSFTAADRENWDGLNSDYDSCSARCEALERAATVEAELDAPAPVGREVSEKVHERAQEKRAERYGSQYEPLPQKTREMEGRAIHSWLRARKGGEISTDDQFAMRSFGLSPASVEYTIPMVADYGQFRARHIPGHFPEYRDLDTTINPELVASEVARRVEVARLNISSVRQAATVLRTPTGSRLDLPTSNETAKSISILGEGIAMADDEVISSSSVRLDSYKFSTGAVKISSEAIQDGIIPIVNFALQTMAERQARGENSFLTTGTGSSQPLGLLTAATALSPAQDITADGLIDLFHSVDIAYRNSNARFMASDAIWGIVRKLKTTTNEYLWQPGASSTLGMPGSQPDTLLGFPCLVNSAMPTDEATDNRTILFGDLSKFIIRDVQDGLRLRVMDELYALSDEIAVTCISRFDSVLLDAGTNPVKCMVAA